MSHSVVVSAAEVIITKNYKSGLIRAPKALRDRGLAREFWINPIKEIKSLKKLKLLKLSGVHYFNLDHNNG